MSSNNGGTYYMLGNSIVAVHEHPTTIKEDYTFLISSPVANVVGMHFNKNRWMLKRDEYIKEYDEYISQPHGKEDHKPFGFGSMVSVTEDHPLIKTIMMYELIGAV